MSLQCPAPTATANHSTTRIKITMKYFFQPILVASLLLLASCEQGDGFTYAMIGTPYGEMKVKLYNTTPKHRDNFIKLSAQQFYDGLLFHRVIPNYMIQGGDPESKEAAAGQMLGQGGPGYTLAAEFGELHFRGALAAARLSDRHNPDKRSSGSQFYIVQGQPVTTEVLERMEKQFGKSYTPEQKQKYLERGGAPVLDGDYTVFGEVVEGLEVIDKIAAAPTGAFDRPDQDIPMTIKILD